MILNDSKSVSDLSTWEDNNEYNHTEINVQQNLSNLDDYVKSFLTSNEQ